jgi:hypothetical protein
MASLQRIAHPRAVEEIENPGSFPSDTGEKSNNFGPYDAEMVNTIWPMHYEVATLEIRREIDSESAALTAKDAWFDLQRSLRSAMATGSLVDQHSHDDSISYEGELAGTAALHHAEQGLQLYCTLSTITDWEGPACER